MIPQITQGRLIRRCYAVPLHESLPSDGSGLWGFPKTKIKVTSAHVTIETQWWGGEEPYTVGYFDVYFEYPEGIERRHALPYTDNLLEEGVQELVDNSEELSSLVDAVSWSEQGMQGENYMSFDARVFPGYESIEPDYWTQEVLPS